MSDLAPSSRRHRIGRFLRTAGLWLADRLIRPSALIPLMVLLATWVGFQMNAGLYKRAVLASDWYDATLIVALLLPPLTGHLTAWVTGHHSGFWWGLWIPAVALYWLRPWQIDTGWAFFWREHLDLWPHFVNIFRLQEQAPLRSFMRLGGVLTMALVTFMVAARSWLRLTAWLRQIGRDTGEGNSTTGAGAGKAGGLPQATWASAAEVRDIFTHRGGIVLGEHTDPLQNTKNFDPDRPRSWKSQGKGRLITMNPALGNGHVVVLAASAGYKTAGIVIPNILHYNDPLVVIDPKGDLYARTRDARKDMGFDARHGFDPFRMIAPLAPEAPSVYLTMARTLMPLGDRASDISEYFHEMSTTLFAALMGHFIAENSTNVAADISAFINRKREIVINEARYIATRHNFPFIKDEMEGLAALDERTFPGVVKGISNKLAFTRFPDIAAYGQSDESPEAHLAALGPKSDIFINFPTQAAEDFSSFPRLLIGAIYVASELIEQPDRPRARRLFLVDEARVLGGMDALNTIRDAGRSLGLHLMLIYQNYGQLTKAWGGESGAAAWLDSCEARVISAVGSSRTANDIVTMLGRRTLRTRVQGSSASSPVMTPMGGSVSSSEQEQIREVPLMSAATLGQLPAHGTLIFTRDKMAPLVKSPDAVKGELEATRRRDAVMKRIRDQQVQNLPDPQPGLRRTQKKSEEKGKEEDFDLDLEGDVEAPAEMQNEAVPPVIDPAAPEPEDAQPPVRSPVADNTYSPVTHGAAEATDPAPMADYRARTQKRIADALAQKARNQKAREAASPPVPAQENGAPGADEVADAGAELETPGVTREQAGTAKSNGGSADAPEQDTGVSETSSPDPILDPDGLTRDDRSALSMIMGMLAIRPALHGTVVRALQDNLEPEAGANLNAREATAADATEGTVRKHEPETEPDIEREKATGTAREGATENPEASEPHQDHASEEKDADPDSTSPCSSEAEKGAQDEPPTAGGEITQPDPGHARKDAEPSPPADDNNRPPVQSENPESKEQPDIGKNPDPNENAALDVPSPNDAAPDPDQPDADLSDPEIDAAIDMLWVEQIEIPPTETGEVEIRAVATDDAGTADIPSHDDDDPDTASKAMEPTDSAGSEKPADPAPSTASKKVRTPARKATPPRKKTARKSDPVARRRRSLDADDVHAAFDPFIEDFFREYLGEPVRPGASDWRTKDRPAFSVRMTGSRRGQYYDHKAKDGGGLFDLLAFYLCDLPHSKADFPRVLEAAADYAGFSPSSETPRTRAARKQRKQERDRKAAVEDQRRAEESTLLVLALRGLVTPVAGSPAETYLSSRHITSWSGTGLGFLPTLDTTLPEPLQSNVYAPEHPALVVWAMNAEGTPTGGQRILLDDAGKAVPVTPAKPSFGSVSGCPARFPAEDGIDAGEPLLVAEGPETALTLRLATGYETWAVFGVSNWQSAPLPLDRDIILAPDRDAALSPAGKTFRKAVAHHIGRGSRLRIAPAPEPEGSKKDLNDTLMDRGIAAVRAALEAAHPPGPEDLPDETADKNHESESHGETAGASETRKNGKDMEKNTEKDDDKPKGQSEPGGSE